MAMDQDLRPRFYEDQYLGADDLNLAIEHGRVHAGRHALGGHTWGIALGLEVRETQRANGEINVFVSPGYAWDGFGRPIVVLESAPLTATLFESFPFSQGLDGRNPEGRLFAVWVRYTEQATQGPLPGFESCENGGQQRRIQETFQFEITVYQPPASFPIVGRQDEIVVDGVSVEAQKASTVRPSSNSASPSDIDDGSIPFQVLPQADEVKQWLIPVGVVRWKPQTQGQAGRFIARTDQEKETSLKVRRYIGVVAESVQAPEGHIRLKDRAKPNSSVWSNDLVWIEGKLRVHGDTRLLAGALQLRNQNNDDGDFPVTLQRAAKDGNSLFQVLLGNKADGSNRFSVGPELGGSIAERFVVQDNGDVGVGTVAPQAPLDVSGDRLSRHYVDGSQGQAVVGSFRGGATEPKDGLARARLVIEGGTDKTSPSLDLRINDPSGNIQGTHLYYVPRDYWPNTPEHFGIWTHGLGTALAVHSATNNIGIGTTTPNGRLSLQGALPAHGRMTVFSPAADFEYDGGNDQLFIFKNTSANGKTAFMGGNVGIGTTTPNGRLSLQGALPAHGGMTVFSPAADFEYDGGNDQLFIFKNTSANGKTAFMGGKVGIGTTTPAHQLYVNGSAGKPGGGSWSSSSDQRLKRNINPLIGALDKLTSLRGVVFEWKQPEKQGNLTGQQIGLIAQEVEKVFPDWVGTDEEGFKDLTIRGFEALTVEALKEIKIEIESLKAAVHETKQKSGASKAKSLRRPIAKGGQ